jgi:hypothetical protein
MKEEAMNVNESKERYMRGFGGKKREGRSYISSKIFSTENYSKIKYNNINQNHHIEAGQDNPTA